MNVSLLLLKEHHSISHIRRSFLELLYGGASLMKAWARTLPSRPTGSDTQSEIVVRNSFRWKMKWVDKTNLSDERRETLGLIKKDKLVCIEESASGGHLQSELAHKVGKFRNHNEITNSNKLFLIEEIREHSWHNSPGRGQEKVAVGEKLKRNKVHNW